MKKLIFYIIAITILSFSAYGQPFSGGSGSSNDPYLISSHQDLTNLVVMTNTTNTSGVHFLLTNTITTPCTTPIGYEVIQSGYTRFFQGTFDGGGNEIYLDITNNSSYVAVGLFGATLGATIKNLTVRGTVTNNDLIRGAAGGIVGKAYRNTTIINCVNLASVTGTSSVGGIVGIFDYDNYITPSTLNIIQCVNAARVRGIDGIGGILGNGSGGSGSGSFFVGVNINECLNIGTIICTSFYCGGIVGAGDGNVSINTCVNAG